MLYLLDKDTKTVKWNGIPLHEAGSAIVKEETNGDFYLTVHYPITDSGIYQLIKEDMLIKAPVPVLGAQLFRIKKPVENDDSLDITAYHITDDVMQRSIRPVSVFDQGCAVALSRMVQNAKTGLGDFSFTSDIMDRRTFNTTETETLYSVLLDGKHSIVGTWEGELVRDNFALSIKRSRGTDRGVVITTHKNLKSYQRTKNSQGVVTRIHAKSTFKPDGAEDEVTLRVTVDSPLINSYPYINEKEYENNDVKTIDELKKWAEAKFKNEGIDKVSDAIEIEAYELDGQVIHLGDTVNIKSIKHDVDLYKKAIAYEYNALTEEYISITFDDNPGVGGSGVSSGVSNAADVILSANRNAQEIAIERAVKNANQAFDAEFEKQKIAIEDGIEQAKAEAELYADTIKQNIDTEIAQVNQSMQAQSEEHDRQVADILSKTKSVEELANQAKSDAASALARANQVKTEAIADARARVATVSQALSTAKTDLQNQVNAIDAKAVKVQSDANALRTDLNQQAQTLLTQAQAQTALTSRVTTVETLADGTRSTVAELSKTVSKATSDITSVTSRTKTVEDTLSQTRAQYEALTQTVNTQTGQIDSINRKTADLQSGIDGVTERFESLQVGNKNYLPTSRVVNRGCTNFRYNETSQSWSMTVPTGATTSFGYGITFNTSGLNILLNGGETLFFGLMIKADKTCSFNYDINNTLSGTTSNDNDDRSKQAWSPSNKSIAANVWTRVWFSYTAKANVPIVETNSNFGIVNNTEAVYIEIKEVIVAKSKVPVDYQSPDADIESKFAEYKRTADQNYAGLQSIVSTLDGKVTQNKSEQVQTADAIKSRLDSLETYKDGESTRAQAYFEASKTETAKQLSAERTAISANYVAKSTYDENVRGTTLKLNEVKTTADTAKQNLATYQETVDRKLTELTTSTQTLDGKINTASAKVDTVAGQIRTEISEVEGKIPTSIGGRNLAQKTSKDWSTPYTNFNGTANTCPDLYKILIDDLKVGDTLKSRIVLKYTNIIPASGRTATIWLQGNGNITSWNAGAYNGSPAKPISGSGEMVFEHEFKITADHLKNQFWNWMFRTDYIASGSLQWKLAKVEKGPLWTAWSTATEDVTNEISSVKTTITQTASGVEQLSTSLSTTNNKVTTAETKINQLIGDVSSKVSQSDYNTLTGRVSSAETAITQNATEISKRLTSTQVESAITGKGYITSSALQPYALATTVQNLVKETADSFSRTISETKALIPVDTVNRNLLITNNATPSSVLLGGETYPNPLVGTNYPYNGVIKEAIWVDAGAKYTFSKITKSTGDNYWRVSYLDSNYAFVSRFAREDNVFTVTIPANVKYMWVSYPNDARCKIEKGDKATAYVLSVNDTATVTALHDVNDTVDSHTRTIGAVGTSGSILDNVSKVTQTANGLVQEVSGANGLKTQVSTLAGSYAIQNLTNSGTVLNQLNLNKDGSVKIDGKLVQITGTTYIQDGVISSAKIASLDAGKITTGTLNAARIAVNSINGSKLVFDQAFVNKMTANEALFKQLFAQNAFITSVQAVTFSASQITSGILRATNGALDIDLNNAEITAKDNAKIRFLSSENSISRSVANLPKQFFRFETGSFLKGGVTNPASKLVIGSNSQDVENSENELFSGQRWWQSKDNASMGELIADQVLIYSNGPNRGPLVFNTSGNVKNFHPTVNSAWDIGISSSPFRYMYIYDIYLQNGVRLGQALKDLANRVGHNGWGNNIS